MRCKLEHKEAIKVQIYIKGLGNNERLQLLSNFKNSKNALSFEHNFCFGEKTR